MKTQVMFPIQKDLIISSIWAQSCRLSHVLHNCESGEDINCVFICESLRKIESGLRQIRKMCEEN